MRRMMGPPPRAERGEVPYLILDAISDQPRHGYEVIQTIEQRTSGGYRPSPGVIYPNLQLLEEMGHATSNEEGGRRVYAITEEGKAELEANRQEVEEAYARLGRDAGWDAYPEIHRMGKVFRRVMRSVGKAFHRGRLEQDKVKQILEVVEDAARQIEKILGNS
jgi:DNA-binding PadR family transcriptional regulator